MQVVKPVQPWERDYADVRAEDTVAAPRTVRTRYTFRDWWRGHEGQALLFVRRDGVDSIREFGLRWYLKWNGWRAPFRLVRFDGKLPESWRYLKNALWHRYNTVTARTLPPTWCDRNRLLLHATFAVLCDFVEQEKPFDHFETGANYDVWYSLRDLYEWWTVRRPAREQAEAAALTAWHDEFMRLGGFRSVPTENPHLRSLQHPAERGADTREEERLSVIHRKLETGGEAEDTAMLHRLVELRGHLWT